MPSGRSLQDRFFEKVMPEPMSGCWLWTAQCNNAGYGCFHMDKKHRLAHRVSFEMHKGKIPQGLVLDHLCRVRSCVNPAHLEPVTHKVNINRGVAGKVHRELAALITHCPRGHPYSGDNLYVRPTGNGNRSCRTCHRERMRRVLREQRSATA